MEHVKIRRRWCGLLALANYWIDFGQIKHPAMDKGYLRLFF